MKGSGQSRQPRQTFAATIWDPTARQCTTASGKRKIAYASRRVAREAIRVFMRSVKNTRPREAMTEYRCDACGGWHVGHPA